LTTGMLWTILTFSISVYLLTVAVRDTGDAADLLMFVGSTLFVVAVFTSFFHLKRYLLTRKVERHVRGK
jgi:hypothetical protein